MGWITEHVVTSPGVLIYVIFSVLLVIATNWFIKRRRIAWYLNQFPGPKALPIIGNALDLNLQPKELFHKLNSFTSYGEMSRVWIGLQPYLFISSAKGVEVILSSPKYIDKGFEYTFLHPWLGTGLLTSSGSKWHSRRKLLTHAFHFKILEDFVDVFNQQSQKMVGKLKAVSDKEAFNIFPYITDCTLDVICETAMGISFNAQDDSNNAYVDAIYKIGHMIQQRIAHAWQHSDLLYKLSGYQKKHDQYLKTLHDTSLTTVKERRAALEDSKNTHKTTTEGTGKRRLAFLDLLLEHSQTDQALSDDDIREEVDTFMFEGHDTTTAGINWSLFLLGSHPDIQERVHTELDDIFGDSDRPVNTADLRELKYLELCIKEALRIYPSVPFFGRQIKEDVVMGDKIIPAGTNVLTMNYVLHRDPEYFPDPEKFDPDRFLPENSKGRHPYAYVPFSAGPRNCIGQKFAMMEEKIILSNILRHYRVESQDTKEQVDPLGELILRPANGIRVKLFSRNG